MFNTIYTSTDQANASGGELFSLIGTYFMHALIKGSDGKVKKLLSSESKPLELNERSIEIQLRTAFGTGEFEKVYVAFASDFVLIPEKYFEEEGMRDHLEVSLGKGYDEAYAFESIEASNARLAWYAPTEQVEAVRNVFKDALISQAAVPVIKRLYSAPFVTERSGGVIDANAKDVVFCHILKEAFELFCLKDGKLHLANRFPVRGNEDRLYFLSNAVQQVGLKWSGLDLYLSDATGSQGFAAFLSDRFNVSILNFAPETASELSAHYNNYFNILAFAGCV